MSCWSAVWRSVAICLVVAALGLSAAQVLGRFDKTVLAGLALWFVLLFPPYWFVREWRRQYRIRRGLPLVTGHSALRYLFGWSVDLVLATLAAGAWALVWLGIETVTNRLVPPARLDMVSAVIGTAVVIGVAATWILVLAKCRRRRGYDWFEPRAERARRLARAQTADGGRVPVQSVESRPSDQETHARR